MKRIRIANVQKRVPLEYRQLRHLAHTVLAGEGVHDYEISLAIVDNATIQTLHRRYLKVDEPTDVLTFPLSEPGARRLAGEIILSADMAQEQAQARGHDLQTELALYVIHGLLHLCGYEDTQPAAVRRMRQRERHYLQQLGLPDITD